MFGKRGAEPTAYWRCQRIAPRRASNRRPIESIEGLEDAACEWQRGGQRQANGFGDLGVADISASSDPPSISEMGPWPAFRLLVRSLPTCRRGEVCRRLFSRLRSKRHPHQLVGRPELQTAGPEDPSSHPQSSVCVAAKQGASL